MSTREVPIELEFVDTADYPLGLSILFTLTVIADLVTMAIGKPPSWVVYSPLPFLLLLMSTGLYMFVLPYAAKERSG